MLNRTAWRDASLIRMLLLGLATSLRTGVCLPVLTLSLGRLQDIPCRLEGQTPETPRKRPQRRVKFHMQTHALSHNVSTAQLRINEQACYV